MCGIRAPLCAMCVHVVQALKSTVGVTSKLHLKKLIQVCLWQCVFISRGVCVSLCVVETVMAVHSPCHALSHVVLFVVAFCFSFVSQRIEGLKDHQEALEARIAHRKAKKEAKVQAAYVVMWCGWLCMGSVCTDAYGTAVGLLRACLCLYHALLVPVLSWVVSCPVLLASAARSAKQRRPRTSWAMLWKPRQHQPPAPPHSQTQPRVHLPQPTLPGTVFQHPEQEQGPGISPVPHLRHPPSPCPPPRHHPLPRHLRRAPYNSSVPQPPLLRLVVW